MHAVMWKPAQPLLCQLVHGYITIYRPSISFVQEVAEVCSHCSKLVTGAVRVLYTCTCIRLLCKECDEEFKQRPDKDRCPIHYETKRRDLQKLQEMVDQFWGRDHSVDHTDSIIYK